MTQEQQHLTAREVESFRRRTLGPAERRKLDVHVAACEDCLKLLLDPAQSPLAFDALTEAFLPSTDEAPFHLSREDARRYAHGKLDEADQTIFESHLETCSECNRDVADLRAVAESHPANNGKGEWESDSAKSRWGWIPTFGNRLPPATILGAIFLIGCALFIWAFWIRQQTNKLQDQAAQHEHRDSEPPSTTDSQNSSAALPAPTPEVADLPKDETAPDETNAIVRLKDGNREVGLDGQGKLTGADDLAPATQKALQAALAYTHLPKPQVLSELSGNKITLMDQSTDGLPFKLLAPIGVVISNTRPTLRWQPLEGANGYTVSIFDSNFNRIAKSEAQAVTAWSVPRALENGKLYSWQVTALKDNQEITSPVAPAPRAQFKIVDAGKLSEIVALRKRQPRAHLTLGVLYAGAGLLDDAEREFQALVNDNPQSKVAQKLLRTVRDWRSH